MKLMLCLFFTGKNEILEFLANSTPDCLKHLDKVTAYKKTRAKLFNERKATRANVTKHLSNMT